MLLFKIELGLPSIKIVVVRYNQLAYPHNILNISENISHFERFMLFNLGSIIWVMLTYRIKYLIK